MNYSYTYPNDFMWEADTWTDRVAPIHPIVNDLCKYLYDHVRPNSSTDLYTGRTDGTYTPKTNVRVYPEVAAAMEEKGFNLYITGMGNMLWIALIPKNAAPDIPVMVRFHGVDHKDENWAMDTLHYYADRIDNAAANNFALVFIMSKAPGASGVFTDILMEVAALWRLELKPIYLDLTDMPEDQFPGGEDFRGLRAMDIIDRWQARVGHQYFCGKGNVGNPEFNFDKLIHSPLGKAIADSMRMEYDYTRMDEPALLEHFAKKGVNLECHFLKGERYVTASPIGNDKKLPLLICMKEVRSCSEAFALTALQFYYYHLDFVGMGECMVLFFAMESPKDNELLTDIIDQVAQDYPVDTSRVYITGQSHNGYLALEYACSHIDRITAVATLSDRHGIASPLYAMESVPVTDEMAENFRAHEMPLINICGQIENVFPHTTPGTDEYLQAIDAFRRRLYAFRCPDKSVEEVEAALHSSNLAERRNGVPADYAEVRYSMGAEVYVADLKNDDGNWYLRFISIENLPHMMSPQMAELSWEFLRRFSRDENGKITDSTR